MERTDIVAQGANSKRSKLLEPAQEQAEVVAGSGEHGVDAIAIAAGEIVAAHAVILLEVADDGFDGGAPAHLAADGLGDTPDLAADPDLEPVRIVVAAIALPIGHLLRSSVESRSRNMVSSEAKNGFNCVSCGTFHRDEASCGCRSPTREPRPKGAALRAHERAEPRLAAPRRNVGHLIHAPAALLPGRLWTTRPLPPLIQNP